MTYTKGISLDVAKPMPAKPIQAKQFDTNSRFLNITVTKAGAPVKLTDDSEVIINIRRADGEAKAFECTVNQDGTISAPIPNWALEVCGEAVCDVSILSTGEEKLTTHSFVIDIADAVYGNDDISEDETYDILVKLLDEVSAVKEAVPTVLAAADEAKSANEEAQKAKEQATDLVESAREEWNAKYSKPDSGIPKADLSNDVQTSLSKADTALQEHQDISGKQDKGKITIGNTAYTVTRKALSITDNGTTTTFYVADIT